MTVRTVLHLIETGGPGGAETMLVRLATALDPGRYRAVAGLLKEGWLSKRLKEAGVETFLLRQERSYDLGCVASIARIVRTRNVALVHAHEFMMNIYGTAAGILTRVPVVATVHGGRYHAGRGVRRLAYRLASRRSSFVAVSGHTKDLLARQTGMERGRILVIHNGIDIERFRKRAAGSEGIRDSFGIPRGARVVSAVGNLYPVKGHAVLLSAAPRILRSHPDVVFLFAGRGETLSALRAQASRLGILSRVIFTGFIENVHELLHVTDVFALPSIEEGFSLVTVEAMASSVPVVATRSGGPEEIVQDGVNGYLVPPGDPDALGAMIDRLLGDRELSDRFRKAGLRRAEDAFSIGRMARNYQALYDACLEREGRTPETAEREDACTGT